MSESAETPKAVVALAGARDGFQLPFALSESGWLERLVTDLYWPADRQWFNSTLGKWLPKSWVQARFRPGLPSRAVTVSARALGAFAQMKIFPGLTSNRYKDKALGHHAKRIALREGAALFCYSTYAHAAFVGAGQQVPWRFLFQLHPHPQNVRRILLDEIERTPQARASLSAEYELALAEKEFDELASEAHLANGWMVASQFTAQTLIERGIPPAQVRVVPYGVDSSGFEQRAAAPPAEQPFTALFVGSLSQRKGLSYLLSAARLLKTKAARILLCGRGIVDTLLLAQYSDVCIEVKVGLSHADLVRQMHGADVLVMPSLAEGFGHVILEAMSCGLPVIATPHTCAPDVLEHGKHGFIVPIRDAEALAEHIAWGLENRAELAAMGEAAAVRARQFTWERFRAGVCAAYTKMINGQSSSVVLPPHASARAR
ncbi:MAG TPA: glycosyltransferase family 4 protein [Blastocatellia bacterium]|nr:glycosyltransferase family 4 protein [Blastocatellia bacterium]